MSNQDPLKELPHIQKQNVLFVASKFQPLIRPDTKSEIFESLVTNLIEENLDTKPFGCVLDHLVTNGNLELFDRLVSQSKVFSIESRGLIYLKIALSSHFDTNKIIPYLMEKLSPLSPLSPQASEEILRYAFRYSS